MFAKGLCKFVQFAVLSPVFICAISEGRRLQQSAVVSYSHSAPSLASALHSCNERCRVLCLVYSRLQKTSVCVCVCSQSAAVVNCGTALSFHKVSYPPPPSLACSAVDCRKSVCVRKTAAVDSNSEL